MTCGPIMSFSQLLTATSLAEQAKGNTRANPSGGICANGDLGIIMGAGTFGICANKVLDKALNYVTMWRSAF